MFRKLKLPLLALGTALAITAPGSADIRRHEAEHHRHRFSVFFGVTPRHYQDGYYDRWGYWHPYGPGYYDARGRWRSY